MSLVTNPEVAAHEFALMLALSTAHMSPGTAADWMPRCPWACFAKGEWGWFMYVCDDVGVTEAADVPLEIRSALPSDLDAIAAAEAESFPAAEAARRCARGGDQCAAPRRVPAKLR